MIFINTRPETRAQSLSQFLQQHGISVIDLPLLELVERKLDTGEISALRAINDYQVVLLVSEEAVKYGLLALAKQVDLTALSKQHTWLAVGEKTANRFIDSWRQHTDVPPPAVIYPHEQRAQNNEGLLALPIVQALGKGDKVQIWRGVGGRELLADTLKAKGVQVDLLNFYQRHLPVSTMQKFADWQNASKFTDTIVVLISSLTAWQHWQQLSDVSNLLPTCHYLVLQSRIANMMTSKYPNLTITVINDLMPATILKALTTR